MWRPDGEALARELAQEFGLPIEGRTVAGAPYPGVSLAPSGLMRTESFEVCFTFGWRSLSAVLQPGAFARPLVREMGRAGPAQRAAFSELTRRFTDERADVSLLVNGSGCDPTHPDSWPDEWERLELGLKKSPATVNTEDYLVNDRELGTWARRFLSLSLALMPLEELEPSEADNPEGLPEGARTRIEVNRYERSRINRAACIEIHGATCRACDFNFGEVYGPAGVGLIIVHHVVPVSHLGSGYRVNPATDLVPLCANCHAIAHRSDPPYSVEAIRAMLLGDARADTARLGPGATVDG